MIPARLITLAQYAETKIPDAQFYMGHWVDTYTWKGKPDLSCGTSACLMGHATTIPEFQALGLRLNISGAPVMNNPNGWAYSSCYQTASHLFDISDDDSIELFSGARRQHEKPKEAAARLRAYVSEKMKDFYSNRPWNWADATIV